MPYEFDKNWNSDWTWSQTRSAGLTAVLESVSEHAAAKINLSLHVVGRRPDGYHLLDSIVAFAEIGDRVEISVNSELSLTARGPFARDLPCEGNNIAIQAAVLFHESQGAAIALDKVLPVAAGMGGGSADAAATLRGLSRLWQVPLPGIEAISRLGADVSVCMSCETARVRGVGEKTEALDILPPLPAVLINPGIRLSTASVFERLDGSRTGDGPPRTPSGKLTFSGVVEWLESLENDLEPVAAEIVPQITEVLQALRAHGSCIARMTGSGATCFGIFPNIQKAQAAALRTRRLRPEWWIEVTTIGGRTSGNTF